MAEFVFTRRRYPFDDWYFGRGRHDSCSNVRATHYKSAFNPNIVIHEYADNALIDSATTETLRGGQILSFAN